MDLSEKALPINSTRTLPFQCGLVMDLSEKALPMNSFSCDHARAPVDGQWLARAASRDAACDSEGSGKGGTLPLLLCAVRSRVGGRAPGVGREGRRVAAPRRRVAAIADAVLARLSVQTFLRVVSCPVIHSRSAPERICLHRTSAEWSTHPSGEDFAEGTLKG
jgi:hypothetical protein